jgi:hypothetical protein
VALRQRLDGVAHISISQRDQLAAVTFAPGTQVFSPAILREALDAADVDAIAIDIEACGIIVHEDNQKWAVVGGLRFRLLDASLPTGRRCVTGRLRDHDREYELEPVQIRDAGKPAH